jgi:Ca2+-binding EF-hand superfamily protein
MRMGLIRGILAPLCEHNLYKIVLLTHPMYYTGTFNTVPGCGVHHAGNPAAATEHTQKEQIMMKTRGIVWILALIWLTAMGATICHAALKDESEYPEECVNMFKGMDQDGDGKVTIEEFVIAAQPPTYAGRKLSKDAFLKMDKNADEVITLDEFCIVQELKAGEKPPTPEEQCEELFKKHDTDHDGKLSVTELIVGGEAQSYGTRKAYKNTFLLMDRNHDEELTQEEFCAGPEPWPTE